MSRKKVWWSRASGRSAAPTAPSARGGNPARRRQRAFTLMEVLVVVSIVALLSMVAYPAYTDQVHKSRRSDAKQALMRASQGLERCYSRYRRFDTTDCDLVGSGPTVATTSPEGHYAISSLSPAGTETLAAETFSLFASPQGSQTGDGRCASLRMDRSGASSATDAAGNDTTALCW